TRRSIPTRAPTPTSTSTTARTIKGGDGADPGASPSGGRLQLALGLQPALLLLGDACAHLRVLLLQGRQLLDAAVIERRIGQGRVQPRLLPLQAGEFALGLLGRPAQVGEGGARVGGRLAALLRRGGDNLVLFGLALLPGAAP